MKKFCVYLILFIPITTFAQFSKGDKFLGGNLNLTVQSGAGYGPITYNSFSCSPKMGYFLNEKYALTAGVGYSNSFYEYSTTKLNYISFSLNAGVRRYYKISEAFYFSLDGYMSLTRETDKQTNSLSIQTTNTPYYNLSINALPKFIFFPSTHWGIEAGLGGITYGHYQNLSNVGTSNSFGLNWSGGLSLGIAYYFKKN